MFRYLLVTIGILLLFSSNINAQFGELFYPLEDDAIVAIMAESPDMEIYAITTFQSVDFPVNFDTAMFQSDLWIYMMRSKLEPYQYVAYGVTKMGKQFIPNQMDLNIGDKTKFQIPDLNALTYIEHNVMDKLRENPLYGQFRANQPAMTETFIILMKSDQLFDLNTEIPESFKNTEIWAFNFSAFNFPTYLNCLVNARTGEVYCYLEIVGVYEELAKPNFEVYPNPANELITIIIDDVSDNRVDIRISDIYGKEVLSIEREIRLNSISLPVAQLSPGVYMINVSCGAINSWSKFIKTE